MVDVKKNPSRNWGLIRRAGSQGLTANGVSSIFEMRLNKDGSSIPKKIKSNTPDLICHFPSFLIRRSFYAVGKSCVINLTPPDDRKFNNCETSPTFRGRDKQRKCDLCSRGAVLPAVVKWLLITGLVDESRSKGVTNSPLNDNYCLK